MLPDLSLEPTGYGRRRLAAQQSYDLWQAKRRVILAIFS